MFMENPTTVLCGPLSNETHSRTPLLAIRSVANTQCSPWIVVSEGASTWWAWQRTIGFSSSPGISTSVNVGAREASSPSSRLYGQLCWCCQPHPTPVHLLWATWAPMEGFRRISTPEEGMKCSGFSLGFYIWSPLANTLMCSDVFFFYWTGSHWYKSQFNSLSSVIYSHSGSHWGFCLSEITESVFSCWAAGCFGLGWRMRVWHGGHKLHSTSSCHQCSEAELSGRIWKQKSKATPHLFLFPNKGKGNGVVVCTFDKWQFSADRWIVMPTWEQGQLSHTPYRWKNFRWFRK